MARDDVAKLRRHSGHLGHRPVRQQIKSIAKIPQPVPRAVRRQALVGQGRTIGLEDYSRVPAAQAFPRSRDDPFLRTFDVDLDAIHPVQAKLGGKRIQRGDGDALSLGIGAVGQE